MIYLYDYDRLADPGPNPDIPRSRRRRKLLEGCETAEPSPVGGDVRNSEARGAVRDCVVRPHCLSARADGSGASAAAAGAPDRRGDKCISRYGAKSGQRIGSRADDRARFHVPAARGRGSVTRFHCKISDSYAAYLRAVARRRGGTGPRRHLHDWIAAALFQRHGAPEALPVADRRSHSGGGTRPSAGGARPPDRSAHAGAACSAGAHRSLVADRRTRLRRVVEPHVAPGGSRCEARDAAGGPWLGQHALSSGPKRYCARTTKGHSTNGVRLENCPTRDVRRLPRRPSARSRRRVACRTFVGCCRRLGHERLRLAAYFGTPRRSADPQVIPDFIGAAEETQTCIIQKPYGASSSSKALACFKSIVSKPS